MSGKRVKIVPIESSAARFAPTDRTASSTVGSSLPKSKSANDPLFEGRLRCGVDECPEPFLLPPSHVPAEAEHVAANIVGLLLEGDEHARLVVVADTLGKELGGKDGLARPCAAGDEGRPALR